jgi:hypothetical protein
MLIFATETEHINKFPYQVQVPSSYYKMHPLMEDGRSTSVIYNDKSQIDVLGPIAPFYGEIHPQYDSSLDVSHSRLPISELVNMFFLKIKFTILEDKDIIDILLHMDNYILEAQSGLSTNPNLPKYLKKMIGFREDLYNRGYKRVLKRHPDWAEMIEGRNGSVADVLKKLGGYDPTPSSVLPKDISRPPPMTQEQLLEYSRQIGSIIYS